MDGSVVLGAFLVALGVVCVVILVAWAASDRRKEQEAAEAAAAAGEEPPAPAEPLPDVWDGLPSEKRI